MAQVGEQGRADDEDQIFEQREIEEDEHEMHHDAAHEEEEAEDGAFLVVQETLDADAVAEPADGRAGGDPEEIHACAKQDRIEDAGNEDPLP